MRQAGHLPYPGPRVKFSFAFDKRHLERRCLQLALHFFFPRVQHNGLTSRSAPRGQARGLWRSRLQFLRRHVPRRGFRSAKRRGGRRERERQRNAHQGHGWAAGEAEDLPSQEILKKERGEGESPAQNRKGRKTRLVKVSRRNVATGASIPPGSDGRVQPR